MPSSWYKNTLEYRHVMCKRRKNYFNVYVECGKELSDAISSETGGDFKKLLLRILQVRNNLAQV